jgi:hypothetical protein
MTPTGNIAGSLDATARGLDAIGLVIVSVSDDSTPPVTGLPNGAASYLVLPDSTGAQAGRNAVLSPLSNRRTLAFAGYSVTFGLVPLFGVYESLAAASVGNVTVMATLVGSDEKITADRVVTLEEAAINHLLKVSQRQ